MIKYWKYLLYVLEHKKNVFKTCWERGLYLHALTHDLSKFMPDEFIPYARYFYGNYPTEAILSNFNCVGNKRKILTYEEVSKRFNKAWELHYKRNKHHPEHWAGKNMARNNIEQMVCDLEAMSLKFGGSAQEYYLKNYFKWDMTRNTRIGVEYALDINNSSHTIKELAEVYNETDFNNYFWQIKKFCNIDVYKMFNKEN